MHLRPCTGCRRHVRADEARCPFCASALSDAGPAPLEPRSRLGRAATNAFGIAVTATSLVACKDAPAPTKEVAEASVPAPSASIATTSAPEASSAPLPSAAPVASVEAAPIDAGADAGKPKVVTKATATATRPPNLAKPYGAPPADGLLRIV